MNRIFLIITAAVIFSSCSKDNFKIEGQITNSQASWIYLEKLGITGTTPFDSSKIDSKGAFELSGSVSYPSFFLLKLNDQKFITLLIDSLEEITFSADYLNFSKDYHVEGSAGSEKVKLLNNKLATTNARIDSIKSLISLSRGDIDYEEKREKWIKEAESVFIEQEDFSKQFIQDNPFSMASVLAIYQKFNDGNYILQDLQTLKMAASALHSMYPKSEHSQTLYRDTEKLVNEIKSMEARQFVEEFGTDFPEIQLPDQNGDVKKLSELKGKTILLQFWSPRNKSCRLQNEVLLENYNTFKNKGFTIYQVNVDTMRSAWVEALKEDQLLWTNVSDLAGAHDAVSNYNVNRIPSNYLIDKEGNIIAKDLKGPSIFNALNEILN